MDHVQWVVVDCSEDPWMKGDNRLGFISKGSCVMYIGGSGL